MANTLYMIDCANDSLYTGITRRPLRKRFAEHKAGVGARHTRIYRPRKVVFVARFGSYSDLVSAERRIKRLPRAKKEALIRSNRNLLKRAPRRRKFYGSRYSATRRF